MYSPEVPALSYQSKKSSVVRELDKLLVGIEGPVVRSFSLNGEFTLHRVDVPASEKNRLALEKIRLREFNSRHHPDKVIICFQPLHHFNRSNPNHQKIIDALQWPDNPQPKTFRKYHSIDLRTLPFISIDSEGVRQNNEPVYADIDDALYIEKTRSGFRVLEAFADVTSISSLELNDPIFQSARKFGYSLYGTEPHSPMLGFIAEKQCSLLEGQDRLAWINEFEVSARGEINYDGSKVYLAEINNHAQLEYGSKPTDPVVAQQVKLIRQVAAVLSSYKSPEHALRIYSLQGESENAKAIAQLMIHGRNILGQWTAARDIPVIYRVKDFIPDEQSLEKWNQQLKSAGYSLGIKQLRSPLTLFSLLSSLFSNEDKRQFQLGVEIFDYLTGRAFYSLHAGKHSDLGFRPYMELKGLRVLPGFANQHVIAAYLHDISSMPNIELMESICQRANVCRRANPELTALRLRLLNQNPIWY